MNHTEKEPKKALLKVAYGVVCDTTGLPHITRDLEAAFRCSSGELMRSLI
jgi:hypothetical protein